MRRRSSGASNGIRPLDGMEMFGSGVSVEGLQ